MSFTNIEPRLKTEIRTQMFKLATQLVADEIVHIDDLSFNLSVPGEDPHFHALVAQVTEQTMEFMSNLIEEAITE